MYFDYASTAPLSESVKEYIISILDNFGNPSSNHSVGNQAKQIINKARLNVAKFINANESEISFTPSGSASNTLAIQGYTKYYGHSHVLYSPIAHKSILKQMTKFDVPLKVSGAGKIDIADFEEKVKMMYKPLVAVDYANSEIGTIQDVAAIIDIAHKNGAAVYLDCTGSISTIPLDVKTLDVDIAGFSGHKLGGLKGCGVLYKKSTINLKPLIYGEQENGYVGGTENVIGIASLSKVVEDYSYLTKGENLDDIRNYAYTVLTKNVDGIYLIGDNIENRLKNNLYLCVKGVNGEALMALLDEVSVQISTGSACNAGNPSPSPALLAIGIEDEDLHSCIRITFSGKEPVDQICLLCSAITFCVNRLRGTNA